MRSQENEDSEWLAFTSDSLTDAKFRDHVHLNLDMELTDIIEEKAEDEKPAVEHVKAWKIESVGFYTFINY